MTTRVPAPLTHPSDDDLERRQYPVDYAESDGEPMAETDLHGEEMIAAKEALRLRYRQNPDVYVASNLLVYYEEGNPSARFAPDVFVVMGVPKGRRRTYKLWVERRPPSVVFEISSRETWLQDLGNKKALCARLGVLEYFLFDPERDYLEPPLQGFRLVGKKYRDIVPDKSGALRSQVLGLKLDVEGHHLVLVDASTGERLLTHDELADARDRAEARLAAALAELRELRRARPVRRKKR